MTRKLLTRVVLLVVTGVSLYLLAPSLLAVFSSWPQLRNVSPLWLGLAVLCECTSYVALWNLQRIAFRTQDWFVVGTSQLASSAFGSIVPGGAATAGAFQYRLLVGSGVAPGTATAGLTATVAATTAAVMVLPALALVAAIGGTAAPTGLRHAAYLGGGAFVLLLLAAVTAFAWDRPLVLVARAVQRLAASIGREERLAGLPARLLAQRNDLRRAFAARPVLSLFSALGKWVFDYAALLCVLAGLGVRPNAPDAPLVLLAYASANVLGMIPATPGGLGFVEAGLVGLLTLAGIPAGVAAVATFAYRLVAFWLPLPAGLVAYVLARRRYGDLSAVQTAPTITPMPRTDQASRTIAASPDRVYAALVDPEALQAWLPPDGMTGRFERFDARPGGSYRFVLTYDEASVSRGKATADRDVVQARFVELVPGVRVVQAVEFVSDDPAYAGTMTMTWELTDLDGATRVDIVAEGVPNGIDADDHAAGMASSLANLAAYLET